MERYSGIKPGVTKAVIGEHAFSHESGIHVCAILEEPRTYELFSPEMVGGQRRLIVGKHTGIKALKGIVRSMGHDLDHEALCALIEKVKNSAETKYGISSERLEEMINEVKGT